MIYYISSLSTTTVMGQKIGLSSCTGLSCFLFVPRCGAAVGVRAHVGSRT